MNIFISNLPFSFTEDEVRVLFQPFGEVTRINLRTKSGKNARAFGLIVMPNDAEGMKAIEALHGKNVDGRPISVSMERQKEIKPKTYVRKIKEEVIIEKPHIPIIDPAVKTIQEVAPAKKTPKKIVKTKSNPKGNKAWEKRKGRGVTKAWKKKPGGIKKKFRHSK